jgi:chromosome segregation ATPase
MSAGDEELDQLRGVNADLKREVQRLSEEMDRIQHRRQPKNKSGKGKHADAESKLQLVPAEVRIAIQRNEDLRKERLKLTAEMSHSDTGRRISETKNALSVVEQKIAQKKDELRALENQKKGRRDIVDMAHHTEDELRLFRNQHREELNGFKDEAFELSDEHKALDRHMIQMQVHIHRISEKIKLGVNGDAFRELQSKVEHQDKEIADLKERIAKVSGDIDGDTKRENAELKTLRSDAKTLRDRIDELKQALVERERELKLSYALTKPVTSPSTGGKSTSA